MDVKQEKTHAMADDLFGLCGSDLADELFMSCLPLSSPVPVPDKPYGSYQTWCLTSTETIRLSRDGEKGGMEVGEEGGRFYTYRYVNCRYQNDSYIKMGSDKSHSNVSFNREGQSHRAVSTNHNL